jgi:ketopantoate reductase
MKVLIVGAGALGRVFGHHLTRGGAAVDALVRPGHRDPARAGFNLWRVRFLLRPREEHFEPARVFDDVAEMEGERWDLVLLCVASTELRGDLLRRLASVVGETTIATIGQGAEDVAALARVFPSEQIVAVVPSLFAWAAPLAGETPAPGTAYWVPALGTLAIGGAAARSTPLVAAFRRGGLRAATSQSAATQGALVAARTMPYVAALEVAGWSLDRLRRTDALELAAGASREAVAAIEARATDGARPSLALPRLALRVLPRLVPFPLERYLAAHFVKVGTQTTQMLDEWIDVAKRRGFASATLEALAAALARARPTVNAPRAGDVPRSFADADPR